MNDKVDLSFADVQERYRTKHVHRLHPYLGKFIPQLVEWFLRRYFTPGQTIIDPFVGSGTTLVEADALGINCEGIDISPWNCLIAEVKIARYDLDLLQKEILDALYRVKAFSHSAYNNAQLVLPSFTETIYPLTTDSEYLKNWYSERARQEILFYKSIIPGYHYKKVLMIILSRAARSARLITHYDLARPTKPIQGEYYCIKHRRICHTVDEALKFIEHYSLDTITRLTQFARIRNGTSIRIHCADSRKIQLDREFDGIFTSPPYVGMIDYHETHRYAYELFPEVARRDAEEIGKPSKGRGRKGQEEYKSDIVAVLKNTPLKKGAHVFIVANDSLNLYPEIAQRSGLEIVETYNRPVLKRTERNHVRYSERVFHMIKL
jgi:hypothetical protein